MPEPEFYRGLVDAMSDGVYFVDRNRRITYWNSGAEQITGYEGPAVVGRRCQDDLLNHVDGEGNKLCQVGCPLLATMHDGVPRTAEIFLHHKDGHRVPVEVRASPITDAGGRIVGAVEVFNDVSPKMAAIEQARMLERLVYIDPLTEAPNRRLLEASLRSRVDELDRYGWGFGLIGMDLDHLKAINDRYGHQVGDKALCVVAKTLSGAARSFDVVGRWGGDEFTALITNATAREVLGIAERFRALVGSAVVPVGDLQVPLGISAGVAIARVGETPEELIGRTDSLLYRAKQAGGNRIVTDEPG